MNHQEQRERAIIIGGGIAGLTAARVLSQYFAEVVVIERDTFPQTPRFRPGVPQGHQVHTILLAGQHALEALFPGLGEDLIADGAFIKDYGSDHLLFYGRRCQPLAPSTELRGWYCSRILIEFHLHRRLQQENTNVQFIEQREVIGLVSEVNRPKIIGVQLRTRRPPYSKDTQPVNGKSPQLCYADLIVDASGDSSHLIQWLEKGNYECPPEETVPSRLGYATRWYRADPLAPWKAIAIQSTADQHRGGALMLIEENQWMVVLSGVHDDIPSTREDKFLAFAESLPEKALFDSIKDAEPLSPIYGYRKEVSRFRHFERVKHPVEGLITIGDAYCSFNPLYGQGMTIAVLEARILDWCLRKKKHLPTIFSRKVAQMVALPWMLATAADAHMALEMQGKQQKSFAQKYMDILIDVLPDDQPTLLRFITVLHMLKSPFVLFAPSVVGKVCIKMIKRLL